jgi:ABC-type Na+ efflux pump permease subunit
MLSSDFPYRYGGPVLAWELTRAGRQRWPKILYLSFILLFCVQFWFAYLGFVVQRRELQLALQSASAPTGGPATNTALPSTGEYINSENQARLLFTAQWLPRFFKQQLLWLFLIAPAVTAGALGHEKERDTLNALFCTELSDREIVAGKTMGRLGVLFTFIIAAMPLPFLLAGFAQINLGPILLCYLQLMVLTLAMVGICNLCAIVTRRTRDAIVACYSTIVIIALVSLAILGDDPLPTWMNPVEIIIRVASPPFFALSAWTYLLHIAGLGLVGVISIYLSRLLLRWACLRQLEVRSTRWLMREVGDDPIRWRERSVIGVAPVQTLRTIPSWLGWAGSFVCSLMFVLATINMQSHGLLLQHFLHGEWSLLRYQLAHLRTDTVPSETLVMSVILLFLAGITVLIRCAGAVSEEKRRKTWDDLLMTGSDVGEMIESKRLGILDAAIPYVVLYALPILGYSCIGGPAGIAAAVVPGAFTILAVYGASFVGVSLSAHTSDPMPQHYRVLPRASIRD